MKRLFLMAALPAVLAGCAAADASSSAPGLTAFASDAELRGFIQKVRKAHASKRVRHALEIFDVQQEAAPALAMAPPAVVAPPPDAKSITNNQVANVDEGGIVKAAGDHLVVLRRGRLFTVAVGDGALRPVSAIKAYPPGVNASGDWYDEMLIAGDWVIVIGYSYNRGGTQVTRFRLGQDGALSYVDAYAFSSADYYSSRNYASRLIGDRLVLYAPLPLPLYEGADAIGPGMSRWDERTRRMSAFRPLAVAARTFIPDRLKRGDLSGIDTAHSVTDCKVTAPVLRCQGAVVLGTSSRSFFVAEDAVFVWTSSYDYDRPHRPPAPAIVYRLPLDGSRPQAVAARGQPIDQFSFHPDKARDALHVVVSGEGGGDAMFRAEGGQQRMHLATLPLRLFGSGWQNVPARNYQRLPGQSANWSWSFRNRFVSDHLLYGEPSNGAGKVHVLSLATRKVHDVALPHGVDRLDAIGRDAVVIGGGRGFLGFSAVALDGDAPRLAAEFRMAGASEGESRSHAFFFRPDDLTGTSGMLGLPVARQVRNGRGFLPSAAVQYLRRDGRALWDAGELTATASGPRNDGCEASCVDWYGNARPIFLGQRVFALLGYEIVEGRSEKNRIEEIGRTDFGGLVAPRLAQR